MIPESRLDEYKKQNISKILKQIQQQLEDKGEDASSVSEKDIKFIEEESEE